MSPQTHGNSPQSDEQAATVSEQGHGKKRANWNVPTSGRIATTCQHTHTVTLRLDEGEWDCDSVSLTDSGFWLVQEGSTGTIVVRREIREDIRAELETALAKAEDECAGCQCVERLRAEARFGIGPHATSAAVHDVIDFLGGRR